MPESDLEPSFKVFARWRPLIDTEVADDLIDHDKKLEKNNHYSVSVKNELRSWQSKGTFTEIYGPGDDNAKVFDSVVSQAIPKVLNGASCNFFAYGHTGSGKTHTIIGYDYERESQLGLCTAAGRHLFEHLHGIQGRQELGVCVSLVELRKNIAFDLLNDRTECYIRQGPDGRTHIRGETEMLENGKVRVKPITKRPCWNYDSLCKQIREGLVKRSVGSSTLHDQSSRTHAILELEIISASLVDARNALYDRQSELVPVGKRATDIYLEETMKALIMKEDGTYLPNPDRPVNQEVIDAAEAEKAQYEARVNTAEKHIESLLMAEKSLGGKLVFVDLAGSEYYSEKSMASQVKTQTPQEKQEGRQINTDLLALKEVIRAFASRQKRIPFRSSPLTMVLREHFTGSKDGTSAMIVTVSPAGNQYAATLNSLKYGSLVGAA